MNYTNDKVYYTHALPTSNIMTPAPPPSAGPYRHDYPYNSSQQQQQQESQHVPTSNVMTPAPPPSTGPYRYDYPYNSSQNQQHVSYVPCLLYTSDAADELDGVDL
eukprot:3650323-Ditylum_brightwellii.AAC.1